MLAIPGETESIENEHMLCVVDSISEEENYIILKIVLREGRQFIDERNRFLLRSLAEDGHWTLLKVCSLENFNRSYVGYD